MITIKDKLNELITQEETALFGFNVQLNLLDNFVDELEDKEVELYFDKLKHLVDKKCEEVLYRGIKNDE